MTKNKEIVPSLLAFDLANLEQQLKEVKEVGIKTIHYDVMDHKFVDNSAFDVEHLKTLHEHGFKVHVHLMVNDPMTYLKKFLQFPFESVTFHFEPITSEEVIKCINYVKTKGIKVGIAVKPNSTIGQYSAFLKLAW